MSYNSRRSNSCSYGFISIGCPSVEDVISDPSIGVVQCSNGGTLALTNSAGYCSYEGTNPALTCTNAISKALKTLSFSFCNY